MPFLVSAKGTDVLAWRASGDFTATFRQQLLARLEFYRADEAEELLDGVGRVFDELIAANEAFCRHSAELIAEVSTAADGAQIKKLTTEFYEALYRHFAAHHSVPAFYDLSAQYLQAVAGAVVRRAKSALGPLDLQLPPLELIALGPAGRREFSPFCPLHLLLVSGESGTGEQELVSRVAGLVHEGFEACGFQMDSIVTPRNPLWNGRLSEWQHRLSQQLGRGEADDLIDFFRIADQTVLFRDEGFDAGFFQLFTELLKTHRPAMAFQVTRVKNLSHGIGLMGGMRFEKKGPFRGRFALLDHALQPLSAALTSLALLKNLETASAPQRIREVLWKRDLNVDMAERLLQAWHGLHELRLLHECATHPDWTNAAPRYLEIEELDDRQQDSLRESLDTVGAIQRHVGLTFSGMEE